MSRYNGHANKHTNDVIQAIFDDGDELTFYCTHSRFDVACKLNQDYKPKFSLVDFLEVMEYFERMKPYWQNYVRSEWDNFYGDYTGLY